ncbi:hypothetical protein [Streptosporangium canum]|uniref:hypothetical protein n=1 Tax=Streptosporangium canum TaxID=324952 RepID=UPI00379D6E1C
MAVVYVGMTVAILRLVQALRRYRARWMTRDLTGPSLEHLYHHYGREILAKAAAEPALSQAIAREMDDIDTTLRHEGLPGTPGHLRAFLLGYGQGVVDSAVIRPDLVTAQMHHTGYPPPVVQLGALCQKALAEGLVRMNAGPPR